MYSRIKSISLFFLLSSCSVFKAHHELSDGHYVLKENGSRKKVFIQSANDSLVVYKDNKLHDTPILENSKFVKQTWDVDVLTIAFKYRPSIKNLPRQLTNDFNGNIFFGYRIDQFSKNSEQTPAGVRKSIHHHAFTAGIFGGLGSTFVSPWTTNNKITDEYNGLVLGKGFAVMVGLKSLTVGAGMGWDTLTDRDKNIWIYQNKPWYGVTIGLSIN